MIKHFQFSEESINQLINTELSNSKFDSVISTVIHEQCFNSKNLTLNRNTVVDKIISSKPLKEIENEIIENILKNNIYPNKDKTSFDNHININLKTLKNKNNANSKNDKTLNNDLESYKLINLLFEEIIVCDDHLTLENYLGDLANFDAELITGNEKIYDLLRKIDNFLNSCYLKDEFLTNNIINILTKISNSVNVQTKTLIDAIIIFSNYLLRISEKFYKITFDISRFYKISVNFECYNNMIGKLHSEKISLKKVESSKIKLVIDNYISIIILNYDETQLINSVANGISTNYIMILLFCLDNDLINLKILFRNCNTRTLMISSLDKYKNFIFVDFKKSIGHFSEKNSFLWKHNSVLEQIYPGYKITKKFLHYAWLHIQINFVGLIVRYRKCRELFYSLEENLNNKLDCSQHFENIISFLYIIYNKEEKYHLKELEEYQKENLFYLIKEICCDFILYCNNINCLEVKKNKVLSLYKHVVNNKNFKYFFEDLIEAFKENVYCDKKLGIGKKNPYY